MSFMKKDASTYAGIVDKDVEVRLRFLEFPSCFIDAAQALRIGLQEMKVKILFG